MNLKRLRYFAKVVDVGSLTQAADLLHVAQPALSQQIVTLEAEVRQQLLIRTKRGVTPTEAGRTLYRHAQVILRQCEQAMVDMKADLGGVAGPVSIGLAPGTAASTLGVPLIRTLRARHPGIVPYLNENYGTVLSELIMTGRMDLGVLYGNRDVHGLNFTPLLEEELFLVARGPDGGEVALSELGDTELFLPRPYNIVRKLVNENFLRAGLTAHVTAEIESPITLRALIEDGLGATILPASIAREMAQGPIGRRRIVGPTIHALLTLCESDHLPLSEPAQAAKSVLVELAATLAAESAALSETGDPGAP